MEVGKLNVALRTTKGSSAVRKLRQQGKIPGICYGGGKDPVLVTLDPTELMKSLDPDKRNNTVIAMSIDGGGKNEVLNVMLRDWQRDALRGNVTHADFVRIDITREVKATVPIVLTGKAEGVKLGGIIHQAVRTLEIACTPDKIPTTIDVPVDALGIGDAIHVRSLKLGDGVRALMDGGLTICSVTAPKAEKVTAAAEGAEAAAAAPAEGAAPAAEAGKAAEGGAKAAPAKGGEKPAAEKKK